MDVGPDRQRIPAEVKLVVAVTVTAAIADALFGHSTPQLVVARLALAAGLLRGLEAFRQLLRIASAFVMAGSVLGPLLQGAWVMGLGGLAAATFVVLMLGSPRIRDWCGSNRGREA